MESVILFIAALVFFFGLAIFGLALIASGLDDVARWLGR
jgi:hypothetical protein